MRYSLVAFSLAALAAQAVAEEGYTAKALFFSENDSVVAVSSGQPKGTDAVADASHNARAESGQAATVMKVSQRKRKPAQLGASYFIRLKNDDGTTRDVLTRRIFKTGEKFQLGVKVNRPSYVYILNEAPDGTVTQIYPQPSQDNFVDAMGVVFLPAKGAFQFDSKPGMEKLMVYLSPERPQGDVVRRLRDVAPDLISNPALQKTADAGACPASAQTTAAASAPDAAAPMQVAAAAPDYTAKGIAFAPEPAAGCAPQVAQAETGGFVSKGIVFSDDQSPAAGGQVASYVVKHTTRADPTLYLKINLAHE